MFKKDFIAIVEFLTTEKGGRKNHVASGYRPHIEFDNYPEYITSGQQTYIGQNTVKPGEKVNAEIAILSPAYFTKRLYKNMKFKFFEGKHMMGYGKIISFENTDLIADSRTSQESININLYPTDILARIKSDFKDESNSVISKLQAFIILDACYRNNRIIRAILYLANKNVVQLEKMIVQAKIDWRDIILWAEYDKKENRVRDFENEFGK